MNRDCNKCIHHISGKCDAWECDMKTLKDYRDKIIDEFTEQIKKMCKGITIAEKAIDEIAEKLKKDGVEI